MSVTDGSSRDAVRRAAEAARLALTSEEEAGMAAKLEAMQAWFQRLEAVDTSGVEPVVYGAPWPVDPEAMAAGVSSSATGVPGLGVGEVQERWRADLVRPSLPREAVLQNAPDVQDGYFKVPRLLED